MVNDTIKSIMERYSCRSFNDKMPSDEDLKIISDGALAAPSGMNRQLWRVIIVKNQELMKDMQKEGMDILASMPDKTMYNRIMGRGRHFILQCSLYDYGSNSKVRTSRS